MQKSAFLLALLCSFGLALSSCKKDEEPSFTELVTANWVSQSVKIDNANATSIFSSVLNLKQDESFTLRVNYKDPFASTNVVSDYTGNWSADESGLKVTLNFDDAPTQVWNISNLTETTMTARYSDSQNHSYEVSFNRQ